MKIFYYLLFTIPVLLVFSAGSRADALSAAEEREYDRKQLCIDYATGDPSKYLLNLEQKEKAINYLGKPRFHEKADSYWTDEMNSQYDADGVPIIGVEILVCKEAKEPRLLIPPKLSSFIRKDLKNLKVSDSAAPGRAQTIALGLLMSLALVSGGVWLARSKQSRNVKIIAVLGITTIGLFFSTVILASSDYGTIRSKQRIVHDLQAYNIARDYEVQFYVMEDNSDLHDVILIVPLNYSKPKERPVRLYGPANGVSNSWPNFSSGNSNFAVHSTPANAVKLANVMPMANANPPKPANRKRP